jgi:hypothetical protein
MELLQSSGYEPKKFIHEREFIEFKLKIESIIELCQEGEFSVSKVFSIVNLEWILAMQYKDELMEILEGLGVFEAAYFDERERNLRMNKVLDDLEIDGTEQEELDRYGSHYRRAFDNMESYYNFLDASKKILWEIPNDKDYQQKRKAKLKSQIVQNGLTLSLGNKNKAQTSEPEIESMDKSNTDGDEIKNSTSSNRNPDRQLEQEKDLPESKPELPPVIQFVLKDGLLKDAPANGKYIKRDNIKDRTVIKYIINYCPYADTLSADLYIQHIHINVKADTIGQYISQSRNEAK